MSEMKRAIVLGASSGIGREMALRFAREGWRVAVAGRRKTLLDEMAALFPGAVFPEEVDVADAQALSGRLGEIASRLGGVDLLVVSAGCGFLNSDLSPDPELRTVATNVAGFTAACVWAFDHFKQRGGGQLAAITSVGGLLGEAAAPAYPASKAYQILYLDSLAKRAKKEAPGIRITELRPGSVNTDMMKGEGHFWISSPQNAAALACAAIGRGKRLQYISRRWALIGLLLRGVSVFK